MLIREMESERKMIKVKRRVLLLISTVLLSLLAGIFPIENCIASGDTIYVDDNYFEGGDNDGHTWGIDAFDNIQQGIDAAISGDTINVNSGTYSENIEIDKDLTLTGQNKDTTVIDAGDGGHVVRAYGTSGNEIELQISGFTIQNAGGSGFDCISLSHVTTGTIDGNKLINGDVGEGMQLDHCTAITISNNHIINCEGSGITLAISENNVIHTNIIDNNQKGIQLSSSSNGNIIYSNTFNDNSQYGVIIQDSSNNRFYQNDFTNNGQHAKDHLTNYWSYNSQGNWWEGYNDYDSDEDGIGDSPYYIPGGDNTDEYPLGYFLEPPSGENQAPTAHNPIITPNPAIEGSSISFSGSGSDSDGFIDGYNWRSSFYGLSSSEQEFSRSDLPIGTHIIYFMVKDNEGVWSSEKTATLTINPDEGQDPTGNQEPIAYIDSITPNPAEHMQVVSFSSHGTDEDGTITEWNWTSDIDGLISTERSFNSSDLSLGNHTISFQVRDNSSEWSKPVTESLIISLDPLNQPPIANAGGSYLGAVDDAINFDGSESYDEDGEIVEYLWNFGDETTGVGKSITHIYTSPGNYTITLKVTDDDGDSTTNATLVTIIQSSGQNSGSTGAAGFALEIPFPVIIVAEAAFIVIGISMFLFWMKRK